MLRKETCDYIVDICTYVLFENYTMKWTIEYSKMREKSKRIEKMILVFLIKSLKMKKDKWRNEWMKNLSKCWETEKYWARFQRKWIGFN